MHQNNSPPDHLFCRCYDDVIHLSHQNRRQHYHHPRRRDDDKSKYSRLYNLSFITLSVPAVKIRLSDFFPVNPPTSQQSCSNAYIVLLTLELQDVTI